MRRGAKRKTTHQGESKKKPPPEDQKNELSQSPSRQPTEENHLQESLGNAEPEPSNIAAAAAKGRRKRAKSETETEYFPEKRNLEDLWQQVFPVGTEWDQLDTVYQYKWNFCNLEDAFEEGGELHNKTVYLFGCTEPQLVPFQGQNKVIMIPVVVAVVSPFPPSDKIGINSVQRETEEIVPMKQMKMDWVPYIPLEKRKSQVERLKKSQKIFVLRCSQRRAGLRHMKLERIKKFEYCLPYYLYSSSPDEIEQSTLVPILYPIDDHKPVFCDFDWKFDEVEELTNKLIEEEELSEDQKEPFKDFVKEKVGEARRAFREEARRRRRQVQAAETFDNMKLYKFYPVSTPNTPDVSNVKEPFINRYYGKASMVL
ncbi:hypothetical protein CASFOL_032528 [Castilleja foliolosa]|uniref:Protein HEAT INTOLERANT 4-like n=1 Tax=Castilleja foliolosa TaxID=1961234 RepID=A0ABD3C2D4_9LAMI